MSDAMRTYRRENGRDDLAKEGNALRCEAPSCEQVARTVGYCPRHYQQVRRHGRLTPERERIYGRTACQIDQCQGKHFAQGYCKKHYDVR